MGVRGIVELAGFGSNGQGKMGDGPAAQEARDARAGRVRQQRAERRAALEAFEKKMI